MHVRFCSLMLALSVVLVAGQMAFAQCPVGSICIFDEAMQIGGAGATDWNAFGFQTDSPGVDTELRADAIWEVYIDDVSYTTETGLESQSFDTEAGATAAGWTGRDNGPGKPTNSAPPNDVDPTDFGYKNSSHTQGSPGEAGGIIARGSFPVGYYADTDIGTVNNSTDGFEASGKLYLDGTQSDSAFWLGWLVARSDPDEQSERFFGFQIIEGSDPDTDNRSARIQLGIEGDGERVFGERIAVPEDITQNSNVFFSLNYNNNTGLMRGSIWAVPEPSSLLMIAMTLLCGVAIRRR